MSDPAGDNPAPEHVKWNKGANELIERAKPVIRRRLKALGITGQDLDDVENQVLAVVASKSGDVQRFNSWVGAVAHNKAMDLLRERGRIRSRHNRAGPVIGTPDVRVRPPESVETRLEHRELLEAVLSNLPPEHRLIIELRILRDMSVRNVAEYLRIPEGTVKSRLARAIERCSEEFRARSAPSQV